MTHITCRLTAKNRDQLRNPTLGNRVWATFTFTVKEIICFYSSVNVMYFYFLNIIRRRLISDILFAGLVNQITGPIHDCGTTTPALVAKMKWNEWTIKTGHWKHFQLCFVRIITPTYVHLSMRRLIRHIAVMSFSRLRPMSHLRFYRVILLHECATLSHDKIAP